MQKKLSRRQMLRLDVALVIFAHQRLGGQQGLLGFLRILLQIHIS